MNPPQAGYNRGRKSPPTAMWRRGLRACVRPKSAAARNADALANKSLRATFRASCCAAATCPGFCLRRARCTLGQHGSWGANACVSALPQTKGTMPRHSPLALFCAAMPRAPSRGACAGGWSASHPVNGHASDAWAQVSVFWADAWQSASPPIDKGKISGMPCRFPFTAKPGLKQAPSI